MADYSLVIRNARIVDGSGRPEFRGDLAVAGDRIAAVGQVTGRGQTEIDAGGLVLAPGFIDVHTHYDPQFCWDRQATPTPEHGVTSLVMGNCSVSLAPVRPEAKDRLIGWFGSVEDMDGDLLRKTVSFDWESVPDYLADLKKGTGPNVGVFIGHAVIRLYVMGEAAQQRAASDDEIEQMVLIVREALKAGAFGLSFTFNHLDERGGELPCCYADRRELAALLREVAAGDRMVEVAPDVRSGADSLPYFELFGSLALETGARVTLSPILVTRGRTSRWQDMLAAVESWRAKGARINGQTQVRPLDLTVDLGKGSVLFGKTQLWRTVMDQPVEGKIAMLGDLANRATLEAETDEMGGAIRNLVVGKVVAPENEKYIGRKLRDIAQEEGRHVNEVMITIILADRMKTEFVLTGMIHADVQQVIQLLNNPAITLGSADAGAHITSFSGAGDTCYLFDKFVRTEKLMSMERAVQRFTADIAHEWNIKDRGELTVGKFADLVVFDPDTIGREPEVWVNDLPGGGGRYVRGAQGISKVIVNGQMIVDGKTYTGATPGRLL
jgi:N-acyl-D-amino-acid deacylase